MHTPKFFLRTKLLPPRPVSDFLPRSRLTDKLSANLNSPVTLVSADAGCGKTALIADFVRNQGRDFVWYQLDHTDADPFTFIGYLTQGMRSVCPRFGESLTAYLDEAGDELLKHPERAADLFLNEVFDVVEQPFIIVLDDYHHIGRETVVHKFVDRALQYSSEILHVIVTSREIPPLAMMKHKARNDALVIGREDLMFADDEVRDLFNRTLGVDLSSEEITEYRERTHGWITALQLVKQVAEHFDHSSDSVRNSDLREMLRRSEKDIFDYFAEEVFVREPNETQEILLKLSLLETMPLDICSRLFPGVRCSAVLPELTHRNVFITVVGDGDSIEEYRLHPLFREFLIRRLRSESGRSAVAAERSRIAEFFLERKAWEKALPYLIDSEEFNRAAEVIAEIGGQWLAGGKITTLRIYADRLPENALEKFPRALLHKAEVFRLQGDLDASKTVLNKAAALLHRQKDKTGEAEALHSLASLARRKGKPEEALGLLARAEALAREGSETLMKCLNTRGLCYAAQGIWAESERHFRLALEMAEHLSNDKYARLIAHNLAIPAGFRGDFSEAKKWMLKIFRDGKNPLPQEAIGHLNIARMHIYRGEFEDALENLKRSHELSRLYGLRALTGEIYEVYGAYFRELGDLQQAADNFERSREAYDEAGLNRYQHEVEEEYAICFRLRGDSGKAKAMLERLLEERKKLKSEFGVKRVELALASLALDDADNDLSEGRLSDLLAFHNSQTLNYEEAQSALLLARFHFRRDDRKHMLEHLVRALDLTARLDYEYWLKTEIKRDPDFFRDEDVLERLPVDLRDEALSEVAGSAASAAVIARSAMPLSDLTVKLLGHVDVFRDESRPLPSDAWTTRRSRDIFCFIASSRHRRVEKDVLIDTFWGDEDFETVEKNFHPTISHIRKALNADQAFKQNFIVFRDGAYQLNPELEYSIDTEEFESLIGLAEQERKKENATAMHECLERAVELYRGEFMTGAYDNWAVERREYFTEQHVSILGDLARISFDKGDWPGSLRYAREILITDPFREDTHRLVMKVHAAEGKVASVKKQYEHLKDLLMEELGVDPAPETVSTYRDLLS